jgi:hypothetical protein
MEAVNAVTYFAPECREAPAQLGLERFWMGYFASRAAPMGAVGPGVVEATFYNFHPARVRRAIPDAWDRATPAQLVDTRSGAAATALRRLLPDRAADHLATRAQAILDATVDRADPVGRPLFAANRDVSRPADPVAALWQACTTLREHRGDAHVALLVGAGLDGCEVHVLFSATGGPPADLLQRGRGWSADDWRAAAERLAGRELVEADGTVTAAGRALHAHIELRTDELAAVPYAALGPKVDELLQLLEPAARRIAASGEIFFPNPMGLPAPA